MIFMTSCTNVHGVDKSLSQQGLISADIADAILFVGDLSQMNVSLRVILDAEDTPKACRVTNGDVESYIREYSKQHGGGQSRRDIARTLDALMNGLEAIIDFDGNIILTDESNAIFILKCLADAYADVPRGSH